MNTAPAHQNRFASFLFIVTALILIGALGRLFGGQVATIIGGVAGFLWGILIGLGSTWAARRWPSLPRRWLHIGAFTATTLFGGTLFAMLLYVASPTPENILTLIH